MRAGRILLTGLILVGLFVASVGAGYLLGQSAFRLSGPPVRSSDAGPNASAAAPAPPPAPAAAPQGGNVGATPSGGPAPVFLTGSASPPAETTPAPAASAQSGSAPSAPPAVTPAPAAVTPKPTPAPSAAPTAPSAAVSGSAPLPPVGGAVSGTAAPAVPAVPTRFHVQVGVFALQQNAEALALRVRALGYAVTVIGGPPYHVRVGGYVDRSTADQLAQNLRAAGFEAFLTP